MSEYTDERFKRLCQSMGVTRYHPYRDAMKKAFEDGRDAEFLERMNIGTKDAKENMPRM